MKKIHFGGLNEVRAIAALMVLFHHIELYKKREGITNLYDDSALFSYFINHAGKNGVYIFFVLSGFLITYLLLAEKKNFTKINIKNFYIRRVLRIWPLYYLIVALSFTLVPFIANHSIYFQEETYYYNRILELHNNYWEIFILFLLFLPNLALKLYKPVVGSAQAWSVGVEEQFYLIWPNLINKVNNWTYLLVIMLIISILPNLLDFNFKLFKTNNVLIYIKDFYNLVPINYMSIGSIGALLYFTKNNLLLNILKSKLLFITNTIVIIALSFYDFGFNKYLLPLSIILQILFIIQENFKFNLRSKTMGFLGKISYGIYMYHPIIMYMIFAIFNNALNLEHSIILYNTLVYIGITTLTLVISYLSYIYFELPFIKLKNKKFTLIKSGE